jgi:hypothetical protein
MRMVRNCCAAISASVTLVAQAHSHWPTIVGVAKSVVVADADDPRQASLEMTIEGADGKPLYDLKCHSGDYDATEFNYSGLMQCYLISRYYADMVRNLLSESKHQKRAWQNRGRYLSFHLAPGCREYPDWGGTRRFGLRGMILTLSITNVTFMPGTDVYRSPIVRSYKFTATAKSNPASRSNLAERASSPEPSWFYSSRCPVKPKTLP